MSFPTPDDPSAKLSPGQLRRLRFVLVLFGVLFALYGGVEIDENRLGLGIVSLVIASLFAFGLACSWPSHQCRCYRRCE